jgi:DNA sulfur modification protein DndB
MYDDKHTYAIFKQTMKRDFTYTFPAIRGLQAGREYFVSMCPLRLIPKLFQFDGEELVPELRAQRVLNKARIPEIARYIIENKSDYVFSAITASVDGEMNFAPVDPKDVTAHRLGSLTVSMNSRFVVNDGQHRRAAIELALQSSPELADETIAVVFFVDRGLERCQQMFADLNRHAVKPSASLGVLYDHRNARATIARQLAISAEVFRTVVEMEKSSLAERSRKLFTLSALDGAVGELLTDPELEDIKVATAKCAEFWGLVSEQMPEWRLVRESKMTAGEVRRDFIHCHAITLQALARVGRTLYGSPSGQLAAKLRRLGAIDWSRSNIDAWEGRAMIRGRMEKSNNSISLTANQIKQSIGIKLTSEEEVLESALLKTMNIQKKLRGSSNGN